MILDIMKILVRSEFLALPAGTVFSKYEPYAFGDLSIKGGTIQPDSDFFYQQLTDSVECSSSDELRKILSSAVSSGSSIELDLYSTSRDGEFKKNQLFAVWERRDVERLISRLQETL